MTGETPVAADTRSARRSRVARSVASVLVSALLGTISLLVAWFAFQASTYGDEAARLGSVAEQMGVDSVKSAEEHYAAHLADVTIWVAITQAGGEREQSPLWGMLSEPWLAAVDRAEVADPDSTALPIDAQYWAEVEADAEATKLAQATAADAAQQLSAYSARLTGATVVLSAALLLLTVASSGARSPGIRIGLAGAATVILLLALVVGAAPVRLPSGLANVLG